MTTPAYFRNDGGTATQLGAAQYIGMACDPTRSVVVRACAGAGKTWLLTARLARLLLAGAEPQDILAITFTRKAAGEMRERLLELLQAWSGMGDAQLEQELHERGVQAPDAALVERARGLYPRMLAGGRLPAVQTFHSWFGQILRAAPLAFGVTPGFELIQQTDALRDEAFQQLYRRLRDDAELRTDFGALVQAFGRGGTQTILNAVFARRGEFALALQAGAVVGALDLEEPQSWAQWIDAHRPLLQQWCKAFDAGGVNAKKASAKLDVALNDADPEQSACALLGACFTADGEGPARSPRGLVTAAVAQALAAAGSTDAASEWAELCELVGAHRQAHRDFAAALHNLRALRLAQVLIEAYTALKAERGALDFDDLELRAFGLLKYSDHAARVQELLDLRWRHLLIDEFQDTNPVQWHALHAWLEGYAGDAQRPTVFIVGDDKQSIYRFRRADPQVFHAAAAFLREAFGAEDLSAQHTRRLSGEVCAAVNAVFRPAQAAGMDWVDHSYQNEAPGLVALLPRTPHRAEADEAGSAEAARHMRDTLTEPYRTPEQEKVDRDARGVAVALRSLIGSFQVPDSDAPGGRRAARAGDVLLLLRKRAGRMPQYLQALQDAGIAAVGSDSDSSLLDTLEAADLLALLRFLVSPGDNLSLAHALKSPVGGVDDATLCRIAMAVRAEQAPHWWVACRDWTGDEAGDAAVRRFATLAAGWMEALDRLPVHDALDRILAEGDLRARYVAAAPTALAATVVARLDAFLTLALEFEGGRFVTPAHLVLAVQRGLALAPMPEVAGGQADAVRVSTIHGAKGLEAPIVVIADADSSPNSRGAQILLDWPIEREAPRHFSILFDARRPHSQQAAVLAAEDAAQAREDWNLLYVAMTRARQVLLVSRIEPGRGDKSDGWGARLEAGGLDVWKPAEDHAQGRPSGEGRQAPPAIKADLPWAPIEASVAPDSRAERMGVALHRVLEHIDGSGKLPSAVADMPAQQLAVWLAVDAGVAAQARQIARQILLAPASRRFFDPATVRWARNEVDVALPAERGAGRALGRIDRLVELDDAVWVLDYKLAGAATLDVGRYQNVLLRYGAAVSEWRAGKPVRLALIAGDGSLIEVPDAA